MMQVLYTGLLYLIQPFVWLKLLWRSRKSPNYRKRWLERYGFCQGKVKACGILIHSVSVGETIAAVPLIKQLQQRYPHLPITVTTMTPTGSQQVIKSLADSVSHVYLPYDLPCALKRFLSILQPNIVIIMETELWPNLITALKNRNIPLVIANARLSARSAKGYKRFSKSIKQLLPKITHIAAQNPFDGERFIQLGLPKTQLTVTGSIKFDITLSDKALQKITKLKSDWQRLDWPLSEPQQSNFEQQRPVWIAASTHQGEDDLILMTHKMLLKTYPDLLLILVPRHPERFITVEKCISRYGLRYQLRDSNQIPTAQTQVVLGNTMGELLLLYGLADIAFVGGSLVKRGGHNPLEGALHHLPIIMGEYTFNFKVICDQLVKANGLWQVKSTPDDLYQKMDQLLNNATIRKTVGENAFQVLKQNQGALERLLTIIDNQLSSIKNSNDQSSQGKSNQGKANQGKANQGKDSKAC